MNFRTDTPGKSHITAAIELKEDWGGCPWVIGTWMGKTKVWNVGTGRNSANYSPDTIKRWVLLP